MNDTEPRQEYQQVIGEIDFPPVESLAAGNGIMVMVVVPSLTEGQDGQGPVVSAFITCDVPFAPKDMAERVDGCGGVKEYNRGDEEAPDQELGPAGMKARCRGFQIGPQKEKKDGQEDRHHHIEAVQPPQLRKLCPVSHQLFSGKEVLL